MRYFITPKQFGLGVNHFPTILIPDFAALLPAKIDFATARSLLAATPPTLSLSVLQYSLSLQRHYYYQKQ